MSEEIDCSRFVFAVEMEVWDVLLNKHVEKFDVFFAKNEAHAKNEAWFMYGDAIDIKRVYLFEKGAGE